MQYIKKKMNFKKIIKTKVDIHFEMKHIKIYHKQGITAQKKKINILKAQTPQKTQNYLINLKISVNLT